MNETIIEKLQRGYYQKDINPLKTIFKILRDLDDNEITTYQMELALRNAVNNLFEKEAITVSELVDYLNALDKEYLLNLQPYLPKDSTIDEIKFILNGINTIISGEEFIIDDNINPDYEISLGTLLTFLYNERRFKNDNGPQHIFIDALENDDIHMFQAFISNDEIDLNSRNYYNDTLLHAAARANALKIIDALLKLGLDINSRNDMDLTPVFVAYLHEKNDAVKYLIDKGADLTIINKDNVTISEVVIMNDDVNLLKYIIEKRGMSKQNGIIDDPYVLAINYNANQVFHYLYSINYPSKYTFADYFISACYNGNKAIVEFFINEGYEVNIVRGKNTPLQAAIFGEHLDIAEVLLEKGANPNYGTYSPLHYAIIKENLELVKLLYKYGGTIFIKGQKKYSPLMIAIVHRNFEIIKYLVENGEDVNFVNHKKVTPLYLACEIGEIDYVQYLLDHGAKPIDDALNPLSIALLIGKTDIIKLLLEHGFVLEKNTLNRYYVNELFYASKKKRKDTLKTLLSLDMKDKNGLSVAEYVKERVKGFLLSQIVISVVVYVSLLTLILTYMLSNYLRINSFRQDVTDTIAVITRLEEDNLTVYYQYEVDGEIIESSSRVNSNIFKELQVNEEIDIKYKNNNHQESILVLHLEQYQRGAKLRISTIICFFASLLFIFNIINSNRKYYKSILRRI